MENILDQKEMDRLIKETNTKALNDCQDVLYAWYGKYADATGMTMAEARKAAQTADIDALAKKAKEYVKNKDFSPEANAEMKLYNFSMKTSRAELLANQLKWRMFEMTDQQERILEKVLPEQAIKELWKQSGILGKTLYTEDEMKKLANYITHTSYKGNTFSANLWGYEQDMKSELDRLIRQSLTMGRNPAQSATQFAKLFGRQQHEAERLIRTEAARVRAHARSDSFIKAGYQYFKWIPRGNPCERCLEKVKVSEAEPFPIKGGDMPPLHPHCYCSTAPVERDEDILSKDAIDANFEKEWQKALDGDPEARAHFENLYQKTLKPDWKQLKLDDGKAVNGNEKTKKASDEKKQKYELPRMESLGVIEELDALKVEYNQVKKSSTKRTAEEIIEYLGGGDRTTGSCASLALAYAGNKNGYYVLDFRDGESRFVFSKTFTTIKIANIEGVESFLVKGKDDFKAAASLVKNIDKIGKEYILNVGKHAAIIRKAQTGYEYLELQSDGQNGFKRLTMEALKERFGCTKSTTKTGIKVEKNNLLIDIDSLNGNEEFERLLGYINTAEGKQMKGAGGSVK